MFVIQLYITWLNQLAIIVILDMYVLAFLQLPIYSYYVYYVPLSGHYYLLPTNSWVERFSFPSITFLWPLGKNLTGKLILESFFSYTQDLLY